jgi:hypothetical protein
MTKSYVGGKLLRKEGKTSLLAEVKLQGVLYDS